MSSPDTALRSTPVARRSWRRTVAGYLALARISNSPTVASNVLAGAALAGATRPDGAIALLAIALILFYTAGMFLNDLCDYAIDCREHPERPLPSGAVSRAAAGWATAALFVAGSGLLWAAGPAPFLSGLALLAVIVLYDAWHKANPLGPLVMAGARLLAYVTAFLAFAPRPSAPLLLWGALLVLYIVGLTLIAKGETGVGHGGGVARYWPAAVLFLPAIAFAAGLPSPAALPLLLLFIGWVAYSISFIYRPESKGRSVGGAIGRLIAGVALFDALPLAMAGAPVGVALALAAFGLTLFLQRYVKGT